MSAAGSQPARPPGRPPAQVDEAHLRRIAVAAFAADGYRGARVDDVASAADVTKPVLFRRFGSKEGLYRWSVETEVRSLTEYLFAAYENARHTNPAGLLHGGILALVTYARDHRHGFRLLFQTGHGGGNDPVAPVEKVRALVTARVEELVRPWLADEVADGPVARLIAATIVGASERLALSCLEDDSVSPEAATQLLTEILMSGLRNLDRRTLIAANG